MAAAVPAVVAALDLRVVLQAAGQERLHRGIRVAADAAVEPDARRGQRSLRSAANAPADQRVDAALRQESRQRAVPTAVGVHDLGRHDLPVGDIVELELRRVTEMLKTCPFS